MRLSYTEFIETMALSEPPGELDDLMEALWHLKKGRWDHAHDIVQDTNGQYASWIHALLHKIEGDQWNAEYWYRKAQVKNPGLPENEEWDMIVRELTTSD